MKIGSYNVKHFSVINHDFSVIANDIKEQELDIVGIQEVDRKTKRSNGLDEPKLLAEALGWHYAFSKATDHDGGEYGHCIVSKYPIVSYKTVALPTGTYETRAFGHAVIDVNGTRINFLNTHLSFEDEDCARQQFQVLADYVDDLDGFIITGDFNTSDYKKFSLIQNAIYINGDRGKYIFTCPADQPSKAIDNIVISDQYSYCDSRRFLVQHSDHVMIYATVTIEKELK